MKSEKGFHYFRFTLQDEKMKNLFYIERVIHAGLLSVVPKKSLKFFLQNEVDKYINMLRKYHSDE